MAEYDNRIVVNTTTYPEGICTLETGKTYKAAPYEGKGGMVEVQNGGTLNTNGAGFSGNSVTRSQDDGGAIHNQGTVNVSGGSFSSNSAQHDGGAIYNKGGTTNISGTDFTGNYTKVLGGAITTSGGVLNITSATFADNVAGSNGGAIFNSSGCVATLTDVAFSGNAAKGIYSHEGGGAIENTRGGIMTLTNVTFDGNTAQFGGAIYNYTLGTINLTGSVNLQTDTDTWLNEGYYNSYYETEENSVVNWDLTGVTDAAQSTVTVNGFQRYSNKKTDVSGEEKLLVDQTITVNVTQAEGDYVIASGDFDLTTLQTNLSTAFTVKTSDESASAAITVNGDTGSIGNQGYKLALVESEEAGADQLVLTVVTYSDRIVVDTTTYPEGICTLETGKTYKAAPYEGKGGMVEVQNGGTLNTNGAGFSGNSVTRSQDDGGAIHNQGTVNVSGGSFSSNSAQHDGGAIYNKGGTTNISGTDFTGNYTKVLGGAITTSGGVLNITSATFADNVAGSNGGAIFNSSGCVATLTDVAFSGNAAKGIYSHEGGGAIENTRGGIMTLTNVTFDGNTAQFGGAIYNYTLGTINLTGSVNLQTDTDTWLNEGYYNSYYETEENSVVNWDLTGVTDAAQSTVTVNGFQRYSNKKTDVNGEEKLLVDQTITVNVTQAEGDYVIATGDFDLTTLQTNLSTAFTVKTSDESASAAITVNGDAVELGTQAYKLALVESEEAGADQLVLTAFSYSPRENVTGEKALETGKTYTAKPYAGSGGAFYVDDNATLTGKDVTFADNAVTGNQDSGGAIFAIGTAVISLDGDIVFSGNTAMCGGAISTNYNNNSLAPTLKFTGNSVRFINNVAKTSDAGAINLSPYNTLTFDSSAEFSGNSAAGEGGALWTAGATTTFNSTVDFSNNTAGTNGGAICGYFYTVDNIVTLNDTATFTGNSATGNGGAIYNSGSTVTINGEATFSGNKVTDAGGKGGAIYNSGTVNMANTVTLATETDTIFNEGTLNWNLTGENTGKLVNYQYLTNNASTGKLTLTVKAEEAKDARYVIATGSFTDTTDKDTFTLTTGGETTQDISIGHNVFYNNTAYRLAVEESELVLSVVNDYTLVLKDGVTYKSYDNGKTLGDTVTVEGLSYDAENSVWTMNDFTFHTVAATAVSIKGDSGVTITVTGDNVITGGDSATTSTSGLYAARSLTLQGSGSLSVTAGDTTQGESGSYGVAVFQPLTVFTIKDVSVTATSGFAGSSTGVPSQTIVIEGTGKLTASANAESREPWALYTSVGGEPNVSAQWNGTVLTWSPSDYSYKYGSSVAANAILTKKYNTRIVVNQGATDSLGQEGMQTVFTVKPCTNDDGGAVNNAGTFTATGVTFANNMTTGQYKGGGAIFSTGTMTFKGDTKFIGNSAADGGGAIVIEDGSATTFKEVEFTGNMSEEYGGAIYNNGTVSITGDAAFTGNTADTCGGAISNDSTMNISGDTVTFTGNMSEKDGGAIYNNGTVSITGDAAFTGNTAKNNGGAIFNISGTLNLNSDVVFSGNTAEKKGGAIYNSGAVNMANTVTLATATDTVYNQGTLNWNLTGDTKGKLEGYQYLTNDTGRLTVTVSATQAFGKYVLATGDMTGWETDETGKYTFKLTGIAGTADVDIKVGDEKVNYGTDIYYSLSIDNKGTESLTDDELVLKVGGLLGAEVDDSMVGKWFKKDETIKITGTYSGDDITSFTFGGNNVTYDPTTETWSYTFTSHDDTKGTDYDIVISTADESETTTYTLKVDTVKPEVGAAAFAGDSKYVDTATGKTWFKKDDTTAALNSVITDETSGLGTVTYNDIAYDETGSKFVISTASEVDVDAQNIQAADKAGNENNDGAVGAYGVDGTEPTVDTIYTSAFKADSVYVDANYNVWVKQNDTLSVDVTITDEKSGLKNAVATDCNGNEIEYKDKKFSNLDTSTECAWGTRYSITATDNVGNENTDATLKYGVDGTGPKITLKSAVTATVCNDLTPTGAPDSANVTKTTDTVASGTDMSGAYTSKWFSAVDTSYTITISDQILKSVTVNGAEQTLSGTSFDYMFSPVQGENVYEIVATDGVGNETKSTITLNYDSEAPVFAANSITVEGVEYAGQDKATAYDNPVIVTDIDSFNVTLNATDTSDLTSWYSFSFTGNDGTWSEWATADAAITTGEGYYRFATIDAAGNTAIADKYFYIGRQIEYTLSDAVDVIYDGQEHGITVTITDPEGGVGASVYYSIDGGDTWTLTEGGTYKITDATVVGPVSVCFKLTADRYCDTFTESTTINIDPKRLSVSGTTVEDKLYDGTKDAVVHAGTLSGIVEGDEVTPAADGKFNSADAGSRTVAVMYTLEGEDAHNYATVTVESVSATITKRSITLESASDSKPYDGTPLTNDTVIVSGDGWVEGEGATYDVTGSQTEVGSSANTFTYALNANTKAVNYDIAMVEGVLTVTAVAKVNNYNNTGKSDMIQFVNGLVYVTYDDADGIYLQTPAINDVTGWDVVETRRDLTGDGLCDVQITSDDGAGNTWVATLRNDYLKDGTITLNYQFIGAYDNDLWSYLGSADVNADGKSEVLMVQTDAGKDQYNHRNVAAWVTDSTGTWVGNEWVGALESNWDIAGTADVTGDGQDNVILRRADGLIGYWDKAGSNNIVEIADSTGKVMLTSGDFSGDGADDFLFTNALGDFFTWTNIDEEVVSEKLGNLDDLGDNWGFAGAGDYNGDGKEELLWCNGTDTAYSEANKENFANLIKIA